MNMALSSFLKSIKELRLFMVFVVGFSVPVLALLYLTGFFQAAQHGEEAQDTFPQALEILSQNTYLKIGHAPELVPSKGSDFLVLAWFNLRRLPVPGQKFILFSKLDVTSRLGYAVALTRDANGIRPLVYWADSKRVNGKISGRWFDFSEIPFQSKSWFLIALSFHNDHLLGLHCAVEKPGEPGKFELQLAGGYEVSELEPPMGDADFISGTYQDRSWRGTVGPIAIISEPNLSETLKDKVKRLLKEPFELERIFSEKSIQLWITDMQRDFSSFNHPIEIVRPRRHREE